MCKEVVVAYFEGLEGIWEMYEEPEREFPALGSRLNLGLQVTSLTATFDLSSYCTELLKSYLISKLQLILFALEAYRVIPLNTKCRPLYLKPQSVPRCKHFSSGL